MFELDYRNWNVKPYNKLGLFGMNSLSVLAGIRHSTVYSYINQHIMWCQKSIFKYLWLNKDVICFGSFKTKLIITFLKYGRKLYVHTRMAKSITNKINL